MGTRTISATGRSQCTWEHASTACVPKPSWRKWRESEAAQHATESESRWAVESAAVSAVASRSCGCVVGFGWMVVKFARVIHVPRAPVCPVCPVTPVCVPAPPGVFLPVEPS